MLHVTIWGTRYRLQVRTLIKAGVTLLIMMFILSVLVLVRDEEAGNARRSEVLGGAGRRHQRGGDEDAAEEKEQSVVKQRTILRRGVLGNFEPRDKPTPPGPGEGGKAVHTDEGDPSVQQKTRSYGINMVACEKISMNRTVLDTRPDECKYWQYPTDLPGASVILAFHNEGVCVIMRTINSILQRSPPEYLTEILLVDDYSNRPELREPLEKEIAPFGKKVRLIRNSKREGLIRTRTLGAQAAVGEVIIFLDAHCEVNTNWLVPLLARIYEDKTIMTVPLIDGIDANTFAYRPVYGTGSQLAGTFEWGLLYKETPISSEEKRRRKHSSEPWRSPTHAGGLFAINRQYFLELGGYDPGLEIWGGENFELSFKIWMCSGSIEWVPCSRVGHVYRSFMPYGLGEAAKKGNIIDMNYKRVVDVWMDEYKEYFYTRKPDVRKLDAGDISAQLAWRTQHGCKSFKWFMDNVAYQVLVEYPLLPPNYAWGEVKNAIRNLCWDVGGGQPPGEVSLHACHGYGGNQQIRLNTEGQLASGERCIDLNIHRHVVLIHCKLGTVNGPWKYKADTGQMVHSGSGMCAETQHGDHKIHMVKCSGSPSGSVESQRWTWQHVQSS